MELEVETGDELGSEVRRLLKAFYAAADSCLADVAAEEIVVKLKPLLMGWTAQMARQLDDAMLDAEDLTLQAQACLWAALQKSHAAAPINDVFAYTKTIAARIFLMQLRKRRVQGGAGSKKLAGAAQEHDVIAELLALMEAQQKYEAAWKALPSCSINERRTLLLGMTREAIHLWVALPDSCPEFARMIEKEQAEGWRLWQRLPLKDSDIALELNTSAGNVQQRRLAARNRIRQLVFGT